MLPACLEDTWNYVVQSIKTVIVVDDHPIFTRYLADMVQADPCLELIGTADNFKGALAIIDQGHPDALVLDVSLGKDNGLAILRKVKAKYPQVRVLVATGHREGVLAQCAIFLGAAGVICKSCEPPDFLEAIHTVVDGGVYLDQETADQLRIELPAVYGEVQYPDLSPREMQVFKMIGEGIGTSEVADQLHISVKTVETHRENLKVKLKLKSASELAKFAIYFDAATSGSD